MRWKKVVFDQDLIREYNIKSEQVKKGIIRLLGDSEIKNLKEESWDKVKNIISKVLDWKGVF